MKAFELINDPKKWGKRTMARDSKGNRVQWNSSQADCFCMLGAIFKVYQSNTPESNRVYVAATESIYADSGLCLTSWNDAPERTHAEVVALLKRLDI